MAQRQRRVWFCLDVDFYEDEKVDTLVDEYGEDYGYRYIKLIGLILSKGTGGLLMHNDEIQWSYVRKKMGYTVDKYGTPESAEEHFCGLINTLAKYKLIDARIWAEYDRVTSNRIKDEYKRLYGRKSRAQAGGEASGKARAKPAENPS